jgi:putative ABC transport system permease protein
MWEAERSFAFLPFHRPALVIEIMRLRRSRSMKWIAFKMLTGDLTKYFSMVFGVAFASLLMAQQMAIFCGIMMLTTAQVRDVEGGDIWVMDPDVLSIDDFKPLRDTDLYRIRGVPGVKWAVPLYKGIVQVRLTIGADRVSRGRDRPDGGRITPLTQPAMLLGLDDASLVGAPRPENILIGSLERLREPDAVFIDQYSCRLIWPEESPESDVPEGYRRFVGRAFEMNERRAVVVGICRAAPNFHTLPMIYTTFAHAKHIVPGRRLTAYVLAKADEGSPLREVCQRINERTGLKALTNGAFVWTTIRYYGTRTGIPINFGVTVGLGFLVGTAVTGLTFYQFTTENLKQFGTLKALGTSNRALLGISLLQALLVGPIGYGLGVGIAALFGMATKDDPVMAFYMPWQVLALTAAAVLSICVLSSLLSVRRVLLLEPSVVFRA